MSDPAAVCATCKGTRRVPMRLSGFTTKPDKTGPVKEWPCPDCTDFWHDPRDVLRGTDPKDMDDEAT